MLKKRSILIYTLMIGMFGVTYHFISPPKALAENVTTYSAGMASGPVCSCPVAVGNCICAFTQPAPPAPAPDPIIAD